jgi:hypothetical protein
VNSLIEREKGASHSVRAASVAASIHGRCRWRYSSSNSDGSRKSERLLPVERDRSSFTG